MFIQKRQLEAWALGLTPVPRNYLTAQQRQDIITAVGAGETATVVASRFGISPSYASDLARKAGYNRGRGAPALGASLEQRLASAVTAEALAKAAYAAARKHTKTIKDIMHD